MFTISVSQLRRVLWLDAASGVGLALAHLGFSDPLERWLGLPGTWLGVSGVIVLAAALFAGSMAARATPPRLGVRLLATGNLLWLAASAWVVWGSGLALTPWGEAWVLAQAVFVLLLVELQWWGSGPARHNLAAAAAVSVAR